MANKSGTTRVILRRPHGEISVVIPIEAVANDPDKLQAHIDDLLADRPQWTHEATVQMTDLPQSRYFRNQWRWNVDKVEPEMGLCRDKVMADVRKERDKRLQASDGPMARANEQQGGPEQLAWKNHRQALRDLPTTVQSEIDNIATPGELETYEPTWPTEPS